MKLTIGAKIYDFEYRLNSICELERETGGTIGEVLSMPQFSMLRWMLWAGLLKHHAMTLDAAGELAEQYLAEHGVEGLLKAVTEAISAAGFMMAQSKATAAR